MKLPASTQRFLRRTATAVGGYLNAGQKTLTSIPGGILESATEVFTPSVSQEDRAGRLRLARLGSSLALGAAAGGLVAGPAGAVVGLAVSFVKSTVYNATIESSGHSERLQEHVSKSARDFVDERTPEGEEPGFATKMRAVLRGAAEGCKSEFQHSKVAGKARTAGFMDGLDYSQQLPNLNIKDDDGKLDASTAVSKTLRGAMGVIGSTLSIPGGLIVGALEGIKGPNEDYKATMKPLLRLCTGLGKAIIPGILGGIAAGPAGAAAATGAGLLFDISVDGINTISDGKNGVNRSIFENIDKSLEETLPNSEEAPSGYEVYYRQGVGAAVGAQVGMNEGWKRGYYGGVEAVRALLETPFQAAPEKKPESQEAQTEG